MNWRERAACKGVDTIVFFAHSEGDQKDYTQAKSKVDVTKRDYCLICLVQQQCLDHAITNNERHGIWGGMDEQERNVYKRKVRAI
jgi:WhiB family redox-sensing transcriptional regulator